MNATIKVISTIDKIAKNGNKYREVWVEISLDGAVFVKKLTLF